ncbi:MAG: hypothetical protein JWM49_1086 [Microbacteriaceae bacterium]|nr:hypothetical protein [Microbacteriaceae bacterium]
MRTFAVDCVESHHEHSRNAKIVRMSLHQLADLMDDLATETWSKVHRAHQIRMSMGEVTISQHNLLSLEELNVTLAHKIQIQEVSQNAERKIGADFEIWLERSDGSALGYSIQAKRVRHGKLHYTYPELSHRGDNKGELQYDTLLRHARARNSVAMHVFYNGWDQSDSTKPHFPTPTNLRGLPTLYGCAAIPTTRVKAVREVGSRMNNKVKAFAPFTFPWSDLLRISPTGGAGPIPVPPGSLPNPSSGGSPPPPPVAGNPSGSPVGGGSGTSAQFDSEVQALAEQMRPHVEDRATMLASKVPDYVEKARNLAPKNLPRDVDLPRYALIIRAR